MSKIVVVVRNKMSISGNFTEVETKEYENAWAANNDRGELIIIANKKPEQLDARGSPETDTVAVFKEWLYWEKKP